MNYYYFFYKKDADEKFAITRALNLIMINLTFIAYTILVLVLKLFPDARLFFTEIKKYGYVYFLILAATFLIHYLLQKKLKRLIHDNIKEFIKNEKSQNKFIVFFTTFAIFLCFVLVLFI
ncbi:hypothetical protein [Niabella aquatica]